MRAILWLGIAVYLASCADAGQKMQDMAEALSPEIAAQNNYKRSLAEYRNCLASRPVPECEGQKAVMNANAQILARPQTNITVQR